MKGTLAMVLALLMLCSMGAIAEELSLKYLEPSLYPVAEEVELDIWCGQDGNVVDYASNPENSAAREPDRREDQLDHSSRHASGHERHVQPAHRIRQLSGHVSEQF